MGPGLWALALHRQHGLGTSVQLPQTSLSSYCSGNDGRCMAVHKRVSASKEGFPFAGDIVGKYCNRQESSVFCNIARPVLVMVLVDIDEPQ
jgi:hypothetical protein